MATKNAAPATAFAVAPPTMVHTRLSGGLLLGTDNSLWLVRKVPLAPIADAKTISEALTVAQPLLEAYEELAALAVNSLGRRNMSRNTYRETQVLLVNLRKLYRPDNRQPLQEFLSASFPDTAIEQRVLLFAVKLRARTGGGHGGLRGFLDSVAHTLVVGGTPMHDFDEDRERISALLARCGMSVPTSAEIALADSWWGQGRQPDTVNLSCDDHLHVFTDSHTVRMADDAGAEDCTQWREMRGVRTLTFATVEDFEFEYQKADEALAHWAVGLVDDGAAAISIRALIEPAKITREELRRQRSKYLNDMREREKNGKLPRHEHEEKVATLDAVENIYATGGTPTLVDASILVAFDGVVEDIAQVAPSSAAVMRTMTHRQTQALAEMMLCSKFRANPVLQDLPSQMVACSGIQSLNTVGDAGGALAGFTERDRQPAYVKSDAASQADGLPIMLVAGATGSGKTMLLLWLALQFSKVKRPGASGSPQIIVDPKALTLDTRIPTPSGWTTMGEIEVGDQVFGRDGKPCAVTHKSRVFTPEETRLYEFVLDDGQVITADQNHQWVVARAEDALTGGPDQVRWREMTTEQILEEGGSGFAVPVAGAAEYPLFETDERPESAGIGFAAGKGLDPRWLRASVAQRLGVLRGAMDYWGHIGDDGTCTVDPGDEDAGTWLELIRSLGIKASVGDDEHGRDWVKRVTFTTSLSVCGTEDAELLPRETPWEHRIHRIVEIRQVEAAPAQCIRVDSPDHTYLVEGYVPTHNTGSDHSPIVKAAGGQVYSLDDLAGADGVFDPLRFATGPTAVELAASMLVSIDPWGGDKARFERELLIALTHGVRAGADCIGQALLIAYRDGKATQELIKPIWELAEASPMFRACVGMHPGGEALKFFDGITLIKVGNAHLDLPEPGAIKEAGITQRTCLALVRMMVFGSAMALTGRGGAIHLDEAWVFLGAGKAEVERLGRLARSQNVLPVLYTQRVSDAVKAELTGYISRGMILPIKDRDEAMAACQLFKLEPTPERMGRITADAAMGGENGGRQPNWGSMRALRDPETEEVVRGAVAYYADLTDRAIPVEITLPPSFLALSSTNPEDIRRREEEARILAAAEAAARPDPVPVPA